MSTLTRFIFCGIIALYGVMVLPCSIARDAICQAMVAGGCCGSDDSSASTCEFCSDCANCCDPESTPDAPIPPPSQPSRSITSLDWFPIVDAPRITAFDPRRPVLMAWVEWSEAPTSTVPRREMLCIWLI